MENMSKVFDTFLFESSKYKDVTSENGKTGVLRTIQGPLAEWDSKNRNNRVYSEKIWDKVLESDYFKEQTKFKTLYGEANHPSDRFEIDFARVSHSITEMHKVSDKKEVHGTIDILDTPLGNILNVLYEYGSIPGFSSRAGGTLVKKKDHVEVDEDTYHFITFDAVPFPSVVSARPLSIEEGVDCKIPLSEEAKKEIKTIINESSKKDREILKSFIYELQEEACFDFSDELAIFESMNDVCNEAEDKPVKEATLHLLKDSYRTVSKITEEKNKLQEEVSRLNGLLTEKDRESEEVLALRSKLAELTGDNISFRGIIEQQIEEMSGLKNTLSERQDDLDNLDFVTAENQYLIERNGEIEKFYKELKNTRNEEASELRNSFTALEESLKTLKEENSQLKEMVSVLEDRKLFYSKETEELNSEIEDLGNQLNTVTESYNKAIETIDSLKSEVDNVNESVSYISEEQKITEETLSQDNLQLRSEIERLKTEKRSVLESMSSKVDYYRLNLKESICKVYGVDSDLLEGLSDDFTIDEVYNLCEKASSKVKQNTSPFVFVGVESSDKKVEKSSNRLNDVFPNSRRR